jgi:hypothetical protein
VERIKEMEEKAHGRSQAPPEPPKRGDMGVLQEGERAR